jgi:hypothetical protein
MLRRIAAVVLIVFGIFCAVIAPSSVTLANHTAENDQLILADFERAAAELQRGANVQRSIDVEASVAPHRYQVRVSPIDNAPCDNSAFVSRRKQEGDKELLTIWRGEWMECYSPISRTSTVSGSIYAYLHIPFFVIIVSAFSFFAAWRLTVASRGRANPPKPQPTP